MDLEAITTSSTKTARSLNSSTHKQRWLGTIKGHSIDTKESDSSIATTQERRELLGNQLIEYNNKQEKLKRKLPAENKLLNCAKDLQLKKQVDILISKSLALQILYLKHHVYNTS